jgi:cell division protein FtsZ
LFNITGGSSLGMFEIDEAAKAITKSIDPDARVKFGAVIDEELGDEVRITVIATGFDEFTKKPQPVAPPVEERRTYIPPTPPPPAPEPRVEPRRPQFTPISESTQQADSDDELDIPAFIRRKMK